jgi:hypothetical protein
MQFIGSSSESRPGFRIFAYCNYCKAQAHSPLTPFPAPRSLRDNIRVGDLLPLDRGSAGHVLQDFPRIEALKRKASPLILTLGDLDPDAAGLSAPVFGADGAIGDAISLSGLRTRFHGRPLARIGKLLLAAAAGLTARLGGDEELLRSRASSAPVIMRAAPRRRTNAAIRRTA